MFRTFVRTEYERQRALERIGTLPLDPPIEIIVEPKPEHETRTVAQNKLLWLWNNAIQKHMFEAFGQSASSWEWHEILVARLCPCEIRYVDMAGMTYEIGRARTSEMSVKQMSEYLDKLDCYCVEVLGLNLPHPDVLYWDAMGAKPKD